MRESIVYIDSSLPADMTLGEYRRSRAAARRPRPRRFRRVSRVAVALLAL